MSAAVAEKRELRVADLGTQTREYTFDRQLIDADARTVQIVASTEEPVERWYGLEILSHKPSAVNLRRFTNGGPVLADHDTTRHIGVVERATVEGRKLKATVRFSASPEGEVIFNDIKDGIRTKFSVGYRVHDLKQLDATDDGKDRFRAESWEPHEVSVVAVPADVNAKVGRSLSQTTQKTDSKMDENETRTAADIEVDAEKIRKQAKKEAKREFTDELNRRDELKALGEQHGLQERAAEWIEDDRSVADFKEEIIKHLSAKAKPLQPAHDHVQRGLSPDDKKTVSQFRINDVLQHLIGASNDPGGAAREMIQEGWKEARSAGISVKGTPIPQICLLGERAVDVGTPGSGGDTVATELRGMIDFLRERLQTRRLGAQFLTGLSNNVDWPVMGRGTKPTHKGEIEASDEYDWTSTVLSLRPHRLPVTTELSHQLVIQSSIDAENYTRQTLGFEIASEMDRTALKGSGAGNVPEGITNVTGVGSVPLNDAAGGLSFQNMIAFETAIAAADADIGSMAYLTHPNYRGTLKGTAKDAGSGQFVWTQTQTGDGMGLGDVNGYNAAVTTQLQGSGTTGEMIFGVWSALVIGQWGGLDLVTDNLSKAEQGILRVIAWTFYDHVVERPEHFAVATDIGAAT